MEVRKRTSVRYAGVFREGDGPPAAGAVVVEDDRLLLEGRQGGRLFELSLPCAELTQVRIGFGVEERLNGYPTVILTRRNGPPVQIAPLGFGLRSELADLLTTLTAEHAESADRVTILVPLKSGGRKRVKELVAQGPPFDPAALGLEGHQVFLTASEAIFVLDGPGVRELLERAIQEPGFWRAGLAWRSSIAGRPSIAAARFDPARAGELVYSWVAN